MSPLPVSLVVVLLMALFHTAMNEHELIQTVVEQQTKETADGARHSAQISEELVQLTADLESLVSCFRL